MRKNGNRTNIEGYLYNHDLKLKTTGEKSKNPGTAFISGNVEIATDNAMINIVSVHFTYVTQTTKSGSVNPTFNVLMNIINGVIPSVMNDGPTRAGKLKIDSAIGLNEFISERSGAEELISAKRNEGGFVRSVTTINDNENARATFKCDMIITKAKRVEANPDNNTEEKMILSGYVFDFRNALLPVDFVVLDPRAMNYFENLEITSRSPAYTGVEGVQISQVGTKEVKEEGAWCDVVREIPSSRKEYVITSASKYLYDWDDEKTITKKEYEEALQNREIAKADVKRRNDEWKAARNNVTANFASNEVEEFKF